MAKYIIPVTWEVYSTISIEADSIEEAIKIFDEKENSGDPHKLPTHSDYVDETFRREDNNFILELNEDN